MSVASEPTGRIAIVAGSATAVLAAGLLSHFRTGPGAANVALVLAGIVVIAAMAGRIAGATTAIVAALAYNFFDTRPYYSLQIRAAHDVVTVLLLAVIGVSVSEIGAWRRRTKVTAVRTHHGAEAFERVATLLAAKADSVEVWEVVRQSLIDTLGLIECRYEPGSSSSRPELSRSGSLLAASMHMTPSGFRLPEGGVAIAVTFDNRTFGHVIVVGSGTSSGTSLDERRISIALVDQYAVALGMAGSAT